MRGKMKRNVTKLNNEFVDKLLGTSDAKSVENMELLEVIEHVVSALGNEDDETEPVDIQPALSMLAKRFDITERQALLFSICVSEGPCRIDLDDLARTLGVSLIKMLSMNSDIKALVERQLLQFTDVDEETEFVVPSAVLKALKRNEVYTMPCRKDLSCFEVFGLVKTWLSELGNHARTQSQTVEELRQLFTAKEDAFCSMEELCEDQGGAAEFR